MFGFLLSLKMKDIYIYIKSVKGILYIKHHHSVSSEIVNHEDLLTMLNVAHVFDVVLAMKVCCALI
jgi:hypothetical protein